MGLEGGFSSQKCRACPTTLCVGLRRQADAGPQPGRPCWGFVMKVTLQKKALRAKIERNDCYMSAKAAARRAERADLEALIDSDTSRPDPADFPAQQTRKRPSSGCPQNLKLH
jgi:hypothetical protein